MALRTLTISRNQLSTRRSSLALHGPLYTARTYPAMHTVLRRFLVSSSISGAISGIYKVLLNRSDLLLYLGDDWPWKRRVTETCAILLPSREHPFQEINDCGLLLSIIDLARDQEPRKTRYGICVLAGGVRDRYSKVRRHILGSSRGGFCHSI